jgi:exonuclease SbcD
MLDAFAFFRMGSDTLKIIHTSDWHLGKMLDGYSRLEEQEQFIDEFSNIVHNQNPDVVIIAGDIFDTANPPARAETLFYDALKKISGNGNRAVIVIAGNHDSPERIEAVQPLAYENGIIIFGMPKSVVNTGKCGNFEIIDAGEGYVEIKIKDEKAVIITLPYPSERRLDEILLEELDEQKMQKSYSDRVSEIFEKLSEKYRDDTINIAVSHLFVLNGQPSESERPIQLGGSYAVELGAFPKNAQYIALGHLHKTQKFDLEGTPIIYSGSPIQYSKSERNNSNCVYLIDVKVSEKASVDKIYLKNYKPIEVWECNNINEAIEKCRVVSGRNVWAYLQIKTDRVLLQEEIKEIRKLKPDVIEIKPIIKNLNEENIEYDSIADKRIDEIFNEFYKCETGTEASGELLDLFLKIANEEEISDETKEA